MAEPVYFKTAGSKIVNDTIEGEVIIINLELGTYYSLNTAGSEVWQMMVDGLSVTSMVDALTRRYTADGAEVQQALDSFFQELQSDGLVLAADKQDSQSQPASLAQGNERIPFAPPQLLKYTDMQDLLLLDPIHDVDEAGWPDVKAPDNA